MGEVIGARVDEVRRIADSLHASAASMAAIEDAAGRSARILLDTWEGTDAAHWSQRWGVARHGLADAAESLRGMSRTLLAQADEQETASSASGPGAAVIGAGMAADVTAASGGAARTSAAGADGSGTARGGPAGWTGAWTQDREIEDNEGEWDDIPPQDRDSSEELIAEHLSEMDDETLARFLLENPFAPPEVLDWVRSERPGALEVLAETWEWDPWTPSNYDGDGTVFPMIAASGDAGGYMVGPDGRTYPIFVDRDGVTDVWQTTYPPDWHPPMVAPDPQQLPTGPAFPPWAAMAVPEEGFHVVDQWTGETEFGERIPGDLAIVMTGVDLSVYLSGPQAATAEQGLVFSFDPDGTARFSDAEVPMTGGGGPGLPDDADIPDPTDSSPGSITGGVVTLVASAIDNYSTIEQMNANNVVSTQIVFQENASGDLRAVVAYRQLQITDDGSLGVVASYGEYSDDQGMVIPGVPADPSAIPPEEDE